MASAVLPVCMIIATIYIGGSKSIILKESLAASLNLSVGNKELRKYAAKTGESYYIELKWSHQTIIAEHDANLTINCESLLKEKHLILWSVNYEGDFDDQETPIGAAHISNNRLTLRTDIQSGSGTHVGNSGTYRCAISTEANYTVKIFVIGTAPVIDVSEENPGRYIEGKHYDAGSQFCLERSSMSNYCYISLRCHLLNGKSLPNAIPTPSVQWFLNNEKINDNGMAILSTDFLGIGLNYLLLPGLINPTPLEMGVLLNNIVINLCVHNVTSSLLFETSSVETINEQLLDLILGNWTCQQHNSLGSSSATTIISDCGKNPTFERNQLVVSEADNCVSFCVLDFYGVETFTIFSSNIEAEAFQDFEEVNISWSLGDSQPCFFICLVNDNITEHVESFELHLNYTGSEVATSSVRNKTMRVIILDDDDDGNATDSLCSLSSHLLVSGINDDREALLETITETIPWETVIPDLPLENLHNVEKTYERLTQHFGKNYSLDGLTSLVNALDSIQVSYKSACSVKTIPPSNLLKELSETFKKATKFHGGNSSLAQEIFGKFLCYSELSRDGHTSLRSKRQSLSIYEPTNCSCPEELTIACHFFACLDVRQVEILLEFGNTGSDAPCIAFIVDTTGSMRDEIDATQRVILQLLKAQKDSTICYMLVPFNDHDHDYDYSDLCGFDGTEPNVGPITVKFTEKESLSDLQDFEEAVKDLTACGGEDYPEYAVRAILKALQHEFIDHYGDLFKPMKYNSHMILLTDAISHEEELTQEVIKLAQKQEVTISFILRNYLLEYSPYASIANETGGILHSSDLESTTWALAGFALQWERFLQARGKRSASSRFFSVSVSQFSKNLRIVSVCSAHSSSATVVHPDGHTEQVHITDSTMIYLNANPQSGYYSINFGYNTCDSEYSLDVNLNARILFLSDNSTATSSIPPPSCTSGKLAVSGISIPKIKSLSLNVIDEMGNYETLPLVKCSNAFLADYVFSMGTFSYIFLGQDNNNIEFTYNPHITFTYQNEMVFTFRHMNESDVRMEYSESLTLLYEIRSHTIISSSNFSLSTNHVNGFDIQVVPSFVVLLPQQAFTVTMTARIRGTSVSGGSSHQIFIYANNGCNKLSSTTTIFVNPKTKSTPIPAATNECGCLHSGTCILKKRGRRTIRRCQCPPEYGGSRCQRKV